MDRGQSSKEDNSKNGEHMPEEDNNTRCTSSTRVIGPFMIDSLNIDLGVLPVKKKEPVQKDHMHFSIRGYVSDVRDQGLHDCRPFPTMELEPLVVPRFRDWRCEQCLQEIHEESCEQQQPEGTQQVDVVNAGCDQPRENGTIYADGNVAANVYAQNDDGEGNNEIQQAVDRATHSPCDVQADHEAHAVASNHEITDEVPERIMTRQRSKRRVTFDETTVSAKENETERPTKQQLKRRRKPRKTRLLSEIYARTESDVEFYKTKDAQGNDTLNETLIELADSSHKNSEVDRDDTEVVLDLDAFYNASRFSTYILPEDNGEAGFVSKMTGKRPLYEDGKKKRRVMKFTNFEVGESSKLSGKFLINEGGKKQQQKVLWNLETGESSNTKVCFWEEMMDHVNESLARTAENLRLQFPGEKAECLSAEATHNNVPTASVCPNNNISGNVMDFDLNFLPPCETDTDRDPDYEAALELLRLGDDDSRNPADMNLVDEANEYMIKLINKNDKKN